MNGRTFSPNPRKRGKGHQAFITKFISLQLKMASKCSKMPIWALPCLHTQNIDYRSIPVTSLQVFVSLKPWKLTETVRFPSVHEKKWNWTGYDVSITHQRLSRRPLNSTKQDRMYIFEGILFFKATNNAKNKQLSCCRFGSSGRMCARDSLDLFELFFPRTPAVNSVSDFFLSSSAF